MASLDERCANCFDPPGACVCAGGKSYPQALGSWGQTILRDRYQIGQVLGIGGMGIIYLAWDHDGSVSPEKSKVAIKEFFPADLAVRDRKKVYNNGINPNGYKEALRRFLQEGRHVKVLKHPNIVNILDEIPDENNTAYIVMEYLGRWTVWHHLAWFWKENGCITLRFLMGQIGGFLDGLQALHEAEPDSILHLDVAPDNICYPDAGPAKLVDFGSAKEFKDGTSTRTNTPKIRDGYSPLELYFKTGYTPAADVYAAAATIYFGLTRTIPPSAPERLSAIKSGLGDPLVSPVDKIREVWGPAWADALPTGANEAILEALRPDKDARTQTIKAFKAALAGEIRSGSAGGEMEQTLDTLGQPAGSKGKECNTISDSGPAFGLDEQSTYEDARRDEGHGPPQHTVDQRWSTLIISVLFLLVVSLLLCLVGTFRAAQIPRWDIAFGLVVFAFLIVLLGRWIVVRRLKSEVSDRLRGH